MEQRVRPAGFTDMELEIAWRRGHPVEQAKEEDQVGLSRAVRANKDIDGVELEVC